MKRIRLLLVCAAAIAGWSSTSFAQRQAAAGGGVTVLDGTGVLNGVDMTASAGTGTLSVGVLGGPQMNIFTTNNPLVPGAVAVTTDASSTSNILFNSSSTVFGNIGVTQPGGPFFLGISGGNAGATVTFLGGVFATTTTVLGTGTLNFNSGATNVTATNFAGDGTISLAANTTVIGALTTTAGANTGTLALGNASVLDGAVGGGIGIRSINLSGSGATSTITGAANSFAFGLGTNTLNVTGAVTIANGLAGGVVNTTLASAGVFGSIRPLGATNLGATLQVNVTVAPGASIPVGTVFNIVQTQTGTVQSGTNGTIVTVISSTPGYVFAAVPVGGTVAGLVAIVLLSGPTVISALPITLAGPSVPDLAVPTVVFQNSRLFQNLWLSRFDEVMCGQVRQRREDEDSSPCPPKTNGWWLKGFGSLGNQGSDSNFAGYSSSIVGTMMAYDAAVTFNTRVGVGVGYARSAIAGYGNTGSVSFDTYRATAYFAHEQGPWFLFGDASFGINNYTSARNILLPGLASTAQSSYSGHEYTGSATTGYHFFAKGFTLTPLASLQYTRLTIGSHTETGAIDVNVTVQSQTYDFVETGLGGTVAHPFAYRGKTFVPEAHAKWLHLLNNPTAQNSGSFIADGTPFTAFGRANSPDTYNVGAGLTFLSCGCAAKTWSLEAVYDYYWRADSYSAHKGMLKISSRI